MVSGLNASPGSRQFLNVANERTFFAFQSSGLVTRLECTSDYKVTYVFVAFE